MAAYYDFESDKVDDYNEEEYYDAEEDYDEEELEFEDDYDEEEIEDYEDDCEEELDEYEDLVRPKYYSIPNESNFSDDDYYLGDKVSSSDDYEPEETENQKVRTMLFPDYDNIKTDDDYNEYSEEEFNQELDKSFDNDWNNIKEDTNSEKNIFDDNSSNFGTYLGNFDNSFNGSDFDNDIKDANAKFKKERKKRIKNLKKELKDIDRVIKNIQVRRDTLIRDLAVEKYMLNYRWYRKGV